MGHFYQFFNNLFDVFVNVDDFGYDSLDYFNGRRSIDDFGLFFKLIYLWNLMNDRN